MADLGTGVLISVSLVPVKVEVDRSFSQPHLGIRLGSGGPVFDLDPELIPIDPILGQIWPRGNVGYYVGVISGSTVPGTLGFGKLFNFVQYVEPVPDTVGQLWPRGDYVPSDPNT